MFVQLSKPTNSNYLALLCVSVIINCIPLISPAPAIKESALDQFYDFLDKNSCRMPLNVLLPISGDAGVDLQSLSTPLLACQRDDVLPGKPAFILCNEIFEVLTNITCNLKEVNVTTEIDIKLSSDVCNDLADQNAIIPKVDSLGKKLRDKTVCSFACSGEFESACQILLWGYEIQKRVSDYRVSLTKEKTGVSETKNQHSEPAAGSEVGENSLSETDPQAAKEPTQTISNNIVKSPGLLPDDLPTNEVIVSSLPVASGVKKLGQDVVAPMIIINPVISKNSTLQNDLNKPKTEAKEDKVDEPINQNAKNIKGINKAKENRVNANDLLKPPQQEQTKLKPESTGEIPSGSLNVAVDQRKNEEKDIKIKGSDESGIKILDSHEKPIDNSKGGTALKEKPHNDKNNDDFGPAEDANVVNAKETKPVDDPTSFQVENEKPELEIKQEAEDKQENEKPELEIKQEAEDKQENEKPEIEIKQEAEDKQENDNPVSITKGSEVSVSISSTFNYISESSSISSTVVAPLEKMEGENDVPPPADREQDSYNYFADGAVEPPAKANDHPESKKPVETGEDSIPKPFDGFPPRSTISRGPDDIQVIPSFPEQEDSHFFFYFLSIMIIIMAGYLIFHNKQKIIALIVEGRHERRRRSSHGANYKKLETK